MADTNLERTSAGGLFRRGGRGFPSLLAHRPDELFSMSPFTLMRRLTEDMDRMFSGSGASESELGQWAPPVEVREENGSIMVYAELPGLNKEDVKVEVNDRGLVIQGERKREWSGEHKGIHRSERSYGLFYREIPLPEGAQTDRAKAEFHNGVLEVRVPVPESRQMNRQIPIETGGERKSVSAETQKPATQTSKAG